MPAGSWLRPESMLTRKSPQMVGRAEKALDPGRRLSYQRHPHQAEHWFIVSDPAEVTMDGNVHVLAPGQAIDIARGSAHRIANYGSEDLVLIEVQHGDYFGEDDIERLEDDFGRVR